MLERHDYPGLVEALESRHRWRVFHLAAMIVAGSGILALAVGVIVALGWRRSSMMTR